jgi:hypothetical protein
VWRLETGAARRQPQASLILNAMSTVILGIEIIPGRSWIALPLVAAVTVLGALEAFLNWRSRWVLMEEAQYRNDVSRRWIEFRALETPPPGTSS